MCTYHLYAYTLYIYIVALEKEESIVRDDSSEKTEAIDKIANCNITPNQ